MSSIESRKRTFFKEWVTIRPCPNCRVLVKNGRIEWSCDDYHPEFFGLPPLVPDEEQERTTEEANADVATKEKQQEEP